MSYYGAKRHERLNEAHEKCDIVLTTYDTTVKANHFRPDAGLGPLHDVFWRRIILDEGNL